MAITAYQKLFAKIGISLNNNSGKENNAVNKFKEKVITYSSTLRIVFLLKISLTDSRKAVEIAKKNQDISVISYQGTVTN